MKYIFKKIKIFFQYFKHIYDYNFSPLGNNNGDMNSKKLYNRVSNFPVITEKLFKKTFLNPTIVKFFNIGFIFNVPNNIDYYYIAYYKKYPFINKLGYYKKYPFLKKYYKKFKLTRNHLVRIYEYCVLNDYPTEFFNFDDVVDICIIRKIKLKKIINNIK